MPRASGATPATITTSATTIFNAAADGGPCTTFTVRCRSTSSNPVLVCVPACHGDLFVPVLAGDPPVSFRAGTGIQTPGISSVIVKGSGGNASIDYWVSAVGA